MTYQLIKGLHIVAVIAWMAGLLYMPRLFVYHADAAPGAELDLTFQTMERKLQRIIMTPAMVAVLVLGTALLWLSHGVWLGQAWLWVKLFGVALLVGWHHFLARARRSLARGERTRSGVFWRRVNEFPFLVLIVIVLSVTTKF